MGWAGVRLASIAASWAVICSAGTTIVFSSPERDEKVTARPVGARPQRALRQLGGKFLDIRAAGIAGDLVMADGDKRQRSARAVAGSVPAALGAEIAVGDIELVRGLAGPAIDKAAQTVEIRLRDAEKGRRVLGFRADERDEPVRQIFASFDARRAGGRLSVERPRRTRPAPPPTGWRESRASGKLIEPDRAVSALSSPSRGAVLAKAGRAPSKDSGSPTSDSVGASRPLLDDAECLRSARR